MAAESKESPKASLSKRLSAMQVATYGLEDAITVGIPNREQIDTVEFKVNAANAAIKTPSKAQQARPDEYYEVKVTAQLLLPANSIATLKLSWLITGCRAYSLRHHRSETHHHPRSTHSRRHLHDHL
jgi:hypothetical protein